MYIYECDGVVLSLKLKKQEFFLARFGSNRGGCSSPRFGPASIAASGMSQFPQ